MKAYVNKAPIRLSILPLQNLSEDRRIHVFCKGLHMDLMTDLARFRSFHIISSENLASDTVSSDYVVKGIARFRGNRLEINLQLIQVDENRLVWAEKFGAPLEQIFQLEEEIIQKIVISLQQYVDHDLLTQIRSRTHLDLNAYESWLYGMEELKEGTLTADEKARSYFLEAIDKDPSFARAYTGMSLTYFNEWSCLLWDKWEENQEQAINWALKALELDTWDPANSYILGKCYLFYKQYQKAEYHLRNVLKMNPSQPKLLAGLAFCFTYLGYEKEGMELYNSSIRLDPSKEEFLLTAALVHFENGLYVKAIEYGERYGKKTAWIDFQATMAAAYFHLDNPEKMWSAWKSYLNYFQEKIRPNQPVDEGLALNWMMTVNPYQGYTHHQPFWEFMKAHLATSFEPLPSSSSTPPISDYQFIKQGEVWTLSFKGKTIQIADLKGLYDIAKLIQAPQTPIHCADLMGLRVLENGAPVLDEKAKKEYQKEIQDLQLALQEAEVLQNYLEIERLQEKYDTLLKHLSQSLGKSGKARNTSGSLEKARSAVTWRIRAAIKKIEAMHPELAKHLRLSIKTGLFCSYQPEHALNWTVQVSS